MKFSSAGKGRSRARDSEPVSYMVRIIRRLVNIVYGMVKHKTGYREPGLEEHNKFSFKIQGNVLYFLC